MSIEPEPLLPLAILSGEPADVLLGRLMVALFNNPGNIEFRKGVQNDAIVVLCPISKRWLYRDQVIDVAARLNIKSMVLQ